MADNNENQEENAIIPEAVEMVEIPKDVLTELYVTLRSYETDLDDIKGFLSYLQSKFQITFDKLPKTTMEIMAFATKQLPILTSLQADEEFAAQVVRIKEVLAKYTKGVDFTPLIEAPKEQKNEQRNGKGFFQRIIG